MRFYRNTFLLMLALIFISGCGANVRWTQPRPSQGLVIKALKEAQEIRDVDGKEVDLASLGALDKLAGNKQQADFYLASIESDLTLIVTGFSRNELIAGLRTPEDFANAGIVNKPIIGLAFQYKGRIKGATFATPHMTDSDDSRVSMILHTTPLSPYTVIVLYEDGTKAQFTIHSVNIRKQFGGGFVASPTNAFDGKLWLNLDRFRHYYIGMPYST